VAREVILPKLGQTMEEGVITEWLVEEGAPVKRGDPLFRLESDKAVLDVEAPASGVLRKILVREGQTVPILTVVGVIGAPDEDMSAYEAGLPVSAVPAETSVETEETAGVGAQRGDAEVAETTRAEGRIVASPRARRLARLEDVPLEQVVGTGPGGRIVERDVRAYLERAPRITPGAKELAEEMGIDLTQMTIPEGVERITREDVLSLMAIEEEKEPEREVSGATVASQVEVERVPVEGIRARIAEKMAESSRTTASFTLTTEVDASNLVAWREMLKERAIADQKMPTYNDLLVRIVSGALQEFPALNARLEGDEIVRYRQINIGIAVDTERGLLVPVLPDVAGRSVFEIAAASSDLVSRARSGQVTPDDLAGGTFTISNLGMFDVDVFTPIINIPECAILGVGRIKERAVVVDGQIQVRPTVVLSLTIDHRAVDGAPAARFLQRVKQLVEEPLLLL